jgi:hypothetical protein
MDTPEETSESSPNLLSVGGLLVRPVFLADLDVAAVEIGLDAAMQQIIASGQPLTIHATAARQLGSVLATVAEYAELVGFLRSELGISPEEAQTIIGNLRRYRADQARRGAQDVARAMGPTANAA